MADRFSSHINGKKVVIKSNGDLYVGGNYTNLKQWDSSSTTWSNGSGQRIKDLDGKSLEQVLKYKGLVGFSKHLSVSDDWKVASLVKVDPHHCGSFLFLYCIGKMREFIYTFSMIFLSFLCIFFVTITLFLVWELKKKFVYFQKFVKNSNQIIEWNYDGTKKAGMYNIVLSGEKPFSVLIGFELIIKIIGFRGFDYFGHGTSDKNNRIILCTYLSNKPKKFYFYTNQSQELNPIIVSSEIKDQFLVPQNRYTPHWWQRLGFFD